MTYSRGCASPIPVAVGTSWFRAEAAISGCLALTIDAAALPVSHPAPGLVMARSIETLASGLPT
jgi:hypothetical protein